MLVIPRDLFVPKDRHREAFRCANRPSPTRKITFASGHDPAVGDICRAPNQAVATSYALLVLICCVRVLFAIAGTRR